MSKLHTAIIGPGLHGKTTLARWIARKNFAKFGVRSIALDPWHEETNWGEQTTVFPIEESEAFWKMVWSTQGHIIFLDEGIRTVARNVDLTPAFTEIRHNKHKLVVIGHRSKIMMTPTMRDQISTLFLFNQTKKSVDDWVEDFADERIRQAVGLKPYYFLHAEKGGNVAIRTLSENDRKL